MVELKYQIRRSYWARWITCAVEPRASDLVLKTCVEGPIRDFAAKWPNFMQQHLDTKLVGKARGAASNKTLEKIYHVFFLDLMLSARSERLGGASGKIWQ